MINLSENINTISLFLLFLVAVISIYLIIKYKRIKIEESDRLKVIYAEIETEKNISKKLDHIPLQINSLQKRTQQKIQTIKVGVLDIDFTLSEIFQ
ncbi:hypothetical protein [Polaribacter septentrionalilitoris]|uniref:hypothetical protein n=1 Tax=Polaribacter septentrionalilitoris TaxID=2494657 RepID=UPI0013575ED3|nr:hypothetical protein [Polaribacter septentrionalilitoris]